RMPAWAGGIAVGPARADDIRAFGPFAAACIGASRITAARAPPRRRLSQLPEFVRVEAFDEQGFERRAGCGIAHGERPRILVGLDAASEPTGDRASQLDIAQRHAIGLAVDSRLDLEGEAGALAEGLGEPAAICVAGARQAL